MADGRGGYREGRRGEKYPNRSDLAMQGSTSGHMAGGSAGMRGSGTSDTELERESPAASQSQPSVPAPSGAGAPPPVDLQPLDAPGGGGGGMLDLQGRSRIFPQDPDETIRALYRMTGSPDLLELLNRRGN